MIISHWQNLHQLLLIISSKLAIIIIIIIINNNLLGFFLMLQVLIIQTHQGFNMGMSLFLGMVFCGVTEHTATVRQQLRYLDEIV